MISKSDIKALEFGCIREYYQYIVQSEENGQRGQVRSLIKDLSKQQKKDALSYLEGYCAYSEKSGQAVKELLIESL